jgi:hypothetical protein
MSFTVLMGNSGEPNAELVFGMTTDYKSFNLDIDQATPEQQKICTDFFELVGGHAAVSILNSAHNFEDCNYVVVSGVETDAVDVDYSTLSNINKGKINAFANLLTSLAQ